jgi:hypothetical protein
LSLCFLTEHHAGEEYWGSECIAPRILDIGTVQRRVVSFTPQPLCPHGKSPSYPLDRRLGGPQNRSARGGEEKNSQPLPGLEPLIIYQIFLEVLYSFLENIVSLFCLIQSVT